MTDQTTPEPLADDQLAEIRMHDRAYATDPSDAPILVEAATDRRLLLATVDRLRAQIEEARARYDAEEVIVDGNVFRRGNLPAILADSMNSGAEHAREAKRLASQIDRLADWLTEHTDEPKDSYGAVEAAINAIEERDAQLNEASAAAWEQGYALGVNDERTAESNIGIAGFGMKVSPARENPYRAAERVETTTLADPEPTYVDITAPPGPAPLTLAQAAGHLHGWARDLADGARTDWPAGHPDIIRGIRGIRAAADWLDARDRYEAEMREQQAAAAREAGLIGDES